MMMQKYLNRSKELAATPTAVVTAKTSGLPDLLAPIASALATRLAAGAATQLTDPQAAEAIFERGYDLVPLPVKLALPKKEFTEYCMRHREPLIQQLRRLQAESPSPV